MDKDVYVMSCLEGTADAIAKLLPDLKVHNVENKDGNPSILSRNSSAEEIEMVKNATILVTDAHLLRQFYTQLTNVKWIQLTYAGVDLMIQAAKQNGVPKYPVTRCSNFQHLLTQYVVAWIINHQRNYINMIRQQDAKNWFGMRSLVGFNMSALCDVTIGILGVGQIGKNIAETFKFFGSRVLGYGRKEFAPSNCPLDGYWYGDGMKNILEQADYIVCVLPATKETYHLLGNDVLKQTKKSPVIVNIGRGELIPEADILKALDQKWISGAILDVFEKEPLSENSPLWDNPNVSVLLQVIITPHIASLATCKNIARAFAENYKLFTKNEPLKNPIDWERGY